MKELAKPLANGIIRNNCICRENVNVFGMLSIKCRETEGGNQREAIQLA